MFKQVFRFSLFVLCASSCAMNHAIRIPVKVLRVLDPDTIKAALPEPTKRKRLTKNDKMIRKIYALHIQESIRFRKVNAPETKTKDKELYPFAPILEHISKKGTEFVRDKCGDTVYLDALGKGGFDRLLADVYTKKTDGENVVDCLKAAALATDYHRTKKLRISSQQELAQRWVNLHKNDSDFPQHIREVALEQGLLD